MLTRKKSGTVASGNEDQLTTRPFRARIPGYTIRILALLGIALLMWKVLAVSALESEQEDALQALRDSTELRISERTTLLARAAGLSVGKSITYALRVGDITLVHRICDALVQQSAASDYVVSDGKGTIIVAMHPDMVGEPLDGTLLRVTSSLSEPLVDTIENGLTRVVVPLIDEQGSLGTTILTFRLP